MGKQLLEVLGAWQAQAAKSKADELKLIWDKDNWFSKLDRQETMQMLGQTRHRLLILAACPDISPDCPESFRNNLKNEVRNSAGAFLSQHYPAASETCPVEFYGDYFKTPISEIDARRLQTVLSAAPTAVLFSEITDYQAHFHIGFWGLDAAQVTHCPLPVWNWEETYHALLSEGMDEKTAQRRIRQMIAQQHQLLAAYVADWYYLHLNPAYQPQLFDLSAMVGEDAAAWAQPYSESLRGMYAARQRALTEAAERARQEEEAEIGKEFSFEVVTVDKKGKIITRDTKTARQKAFDLGGGVTLDMAYIPGDTFWMGSPDSVGSDDEHPRHQVTVAPFYMGKYPVTQAQWKAVMGKDSPNLKRITSERKGDQRPMIHVSWNDAQEFLEKLNAVASPVETHGRASLQFRLPSEAEWEYACRAGTTTPFYFGETITTELANYDGNFESAYGDGPEGEYRRQTTDVGSFPPNVFGLYDMHGNVWEWCQDWYDDGYYAKSPKENPQGPSSGERRLLRGGSWINEPNGVRSAYRYGNVPVLQSYCVGFRVVAVSRTQ